MSVVLQRFSRTSNAGGAPARENNVVSLGGEIDARGLPPGPDLRPCKSLTRSNAEIGVVIANALQGLAGDTDVVDVGVRGDLTGKDHETYREVPFKVPAGIGRLTVTFEYTGRDQRSVISPTFPW